MIQETAIHGVLTMPLRQIEDERGAVLHMVRSDWPIFERFGEIYFSEVNHGHVKAWKRHRLMTQHFAVPRGRIRLVIHDTRPDSPSLGVIETIILGRPDRYLLIKIPPGLWYGFQGVSEEPALLANMADRPHDPYESETLDVESANFPVGW